MGENQEYVQQTPDPRSHVISTFVTLPSPSCFLDSALTSAVAKKNSLSKIAERRDRCLRAQNVAKV